MLKSTKYRWFAAQNGMTNIIFRDMYIERNHAFPYFTNTFPRFLGTHGKLFLQYKASISSISRSCPYFPQSQWFNGMLPSFKWTIPNKSVTQGMLENNAIKISTTSVKLAGKVFHSAREKKKTQKEQHKDKPVEAANWSTLQRNYRIIFATGNIQRRAGQKRPAVWSGHRSDWCRWKHATHIHILPVSCWMLTFFYRVCVRARCFVLHLCCFSFNFYVFFCVAWNTSAV